MQFPLLNFTTRCCKVQEWRGLSGQGRMNNTPERREPVVEDFGDMLQQSSVTDHYGDRATAPRPPILVLPCPQPALGAWRRCRLRLRAPCAAPRRKARTCTVASDVAAPRSRTSYSPHGMDVRVERPKVRGCVRAVCCDTLFPQLRCCSRKRLLTRETARAGCSRACAWGVWVCGVWDVCMCVRGRLQKSGSRLARAPLPWSRLDVTLTRALQVALIS